MSGEERMEVYEKKLREKPVIPTTNVSGSGSVHIEGIGEIHIAGSGFVSPEEIRISGSGRLPGGIKVRRMSCSGSVSIEGDVEAEDMSLAGSASIDGNVKAKVLSASGAFSAREEVKAESMKVAGSCKVRKGIELEDSLRVFGGLRVAGDVKAKSLVDLHGVFDVDGEVVADVFEARLSRSESHVGKGIRAASVDISKWARGGIVVFGIRVFRRFFRKGRLYTSDIVGRDKVFLENVYCDSVQGRDVTIGEGCSVRGKIQYSESISLHPTAKVACSPEKVS